MRPRPPYGMNGRIIDARTCSPIPYANVIVTGTTLGAMTDAAGKYRVRGVPAGEQHVRAMMMQYQGIDAMVITGVGDSTRADFIMCEVWSDQVLPRPTIGAPGCPVHSVPMKWVLVPASVRVVTDSPRFRELEFPFAWPAIESTATPGAIKVGWVESCSECADLLNDRESGHRWERLVKRAPAGWGRYHLGSGLEFEAPAGLSDSVVLNTCTMSGVWKGTNLAVEIRRVPQWQSLFGPRLASAADVRYRVWELIGDCKAEFTVVEQGDSSQVIARLASTEDSVDEIEIMVESVGKDALRIARTILGTMDFPDRRDDL